MSRDQRLLLVSILIFVGLALYHFRPGWIRWPMAKKAPETRTRPATAQPTLQPIPAEGSTQVSFRGEVLEETTPWGRNPFLTEEEAKGKVRRDDGLQVKAIIVGWPKPVATIDGRTVLVGERVGEETVREILPDAVVLERGGSRRVLKVSQPGISIEVKDVKR